MALTFTPRAVDHLNNVKTIAADLYWTNTSVTLDASYATNGVALTPQNLGFTGAVFLGIVSVRTSAGNVSAGCLDTSVNGKPSAPLLKLQASATTTAELGAGAGTGAIVDVLAYGF